jgi:hypothetical protein
MFAIKKQLGYRQIKREKAHAGGLGHAFSFCESAQATASAAALLFQRLT